MIRPKEHLLGSSMPKAKQEIAAFIDLFVLFTGTEMVIISVIPFSGSNKMSTSMGRGAVGRKSPGLARSAYRWYKIVFLLKVSFQLN